MILILDFPRRNSQKCTQGAGWDFGDGGPKLQGVPGGLPQDSALLGRHHSKSYEVFMSPSGSRNGGSGIQVS